MQRCRFPTRYACAISLFLLVAPLANAAIDPSAPLVRALEALRSAEATTRARFVELAVDALVARHRAVLQGSGRDPSWSQAHARTSHAWRPRRRRRGAVRACC